MSKKTKPVDELVRIAKAMALDKLNADRSAVSLPPLRRVPKLWWKFYGDGWLLEAAGTMV